MRLWLILCSLTLSLGTSVSGLFLFGNCQSACVVCSTADEGCAVGSQPLKVTYWRFVLHIPLNEGEAIANAAQGGVVLLKVNLMHPAKSFILSR